MIRSVPPSRYILFGLVATAGLTIDLWTKNAVFADLGVNRSSVWSYGWFDDWLQFRFHTTFNPGALWGIGQGWTWLFASLSVVAVIGVLCWLFVWGAAKSAWLTVALALIMSGALGNLYDRFGWHAHELPGGGRIFAVRDFLYFRFGDFDWPIFNFADVFLVTGAIMLVLQSFKAESEAAAANETVRQPVIAEAARDTSAA
jgi:signal peptidase II